MAVSDDAEWRRREELADLLRTCRSRLVRPVGDGGAGGLRQEDVAGLAGLSVRRYAAFERGEIPSPLPEMVESVASALRMTAAERSALHILATGHDWRTPSGAGHDGARPGLSLVVLELMARQDPSPAIITDDMWAVVARNKAMSAWAGEWLDRAPPAQQNAVLYLFSDHCAARVLDVHDLRRATVSVLRYQYSRNIASGRFAALIERLLATGPEARQLWARHEIQLPQQEYPLRVRHPRYGVVQAADAVLQIWPDDYWLHVIVFSEGVLPPGR